MLQRIFRPIYIFNNYAYFLDFRAQKFPLILTLHFGFKIMKNNIKKAPVKFWEDLLYFQHFMQIFVFAQISDYHHLKERKLNTLTLEIDLSQIFTCRRGWSGGAKVLGKLSVPGRPTILITVGQGPIALAVGAGGGGLDIFTLIYPFLSLSLSLGDGPI